MFIFIKLKGLKLLLIPIKLAHKVCAFRGNIILIKVLYFSQIPASRTLIATAPNRHHSRWWLCRLIPSSPATPAISSPVPPVPPTSTLLARRRSSFRYVSVCTSPTSRDATQSFPTGSRRPTLPLLTTTTHNSNERCAHFPLTPPIVGGGLDRRSRSYLSRRRKDDSRRIGSGSLVYGVDLN